MVKSRQFYPSQDEPMSPTSVRSREWEGPSRWTEYLGPEMASSVSSRSSKQLSSDGHVQSSGGSTKALNIQWVVQMIGLRLKPNKQQKLKDKKKEIDVNIHLIVAPSADSGKIKVGVSHKKSDQNEAMEE